MKHLHVCTRKGLFTFRRAGSGWEIVDTSFLGDPVLGVCDDGSIAALDLGHFGAKLRRRDGDAWTELKVPVYPEQPEPTPGAKPDVKWSLDKLWCMSRDVSGTYWAGTIPGGLFKSDDPAEGWTLVRSLWDRKERQLWFGGGFDAPGVHSICPHPNDARELVVGVSCGGVWRTGDGGDSWDLVGDGLFADYMPETKRDMKAVQDPHAIRRCAAEPDVLWMQHHNGAFRSTDGGTSWTSLQVPPSAFGFAVAAHPRDPDTAWFVPAVKDEQRIPVDGAVVVARTRDGGRSFDVLRSGLPQEHAYDLVFRHALDVDASGEVLAFGSTTGSLWLSEDAGDSWTTLSSHLPPVYAVRFAP